MCEHKNANTIHMILPLRYITKIFIHKNFYSQTMKNAIVIAFLFNMNIHIKYI